MNSIAEIIDFVGHLGDALKNISDAVLDTIDRGYRTLDLLAVRRAKKRLTRLHKYGTELGAVQVPMTRKLGWYLQEPSDANWAEAREDIKKVLEAIPEVDSELSEEDSAFVLEPAYKQYLLTLEERKRLLSLLLNMEPPQSDEEIAMLKQLQETYHRLMENLERIQCNLSDYIKEHFPGEKAWLDD